MCGRSLLCDGVNHRAGAEEEQRLEEAVRQQVEEAGGREAGADRRHHVAELRDGGVGEHALDVVLHAREHRRQQRRERADPRDDRAARPASARTATRSACSRYTPAVTIVAA